MEAEKVLEEEEEEHFFADLVTSDRDREADEEEEEELEEEDHLNASSESLEGPASGGGGSAAVPTTEQDRRAQIGASPYMAPFTPLSSPNHPKTPSSASTAQRNSSKKPQLVPMKNGPAGAGGPFAGAVAGGGSGSGSKIPKDDVVAHLPNELVECLMNTVHTLDKLILGVEDYNAEQLGGLADKANAYVDLLRQMDTFGSQYHAMIPLQVLECVDVLSGMLAAGVLLLTCFVFCTRKE